MLALSLFVCNEQSVYAQVDLSSETVANVNIASAETRKPAINGNSPSIRYERAKQLIAEKKYIQGVEICEQLLQETTEESQTKDERALWVASAVSGLLLAFRGKERLEVQYLERAVMLFMRYKQELSVAYGSDKIDSELVNHWLKEIDIASSEWENQKQQLAEFERMQSQAREAYERHDYASEARHWQSTLTHPSAPRSGPERADLIINAVQANLRIHDLQPRTEYLDQAGRLLRQLHREGETATNPRLQSEYTRLDQEVTNRRKQAKKELKGSEEIISADRYIHNRRGATLVSVGASVLGLSLGGFIAATQIVDAAERKIDNYPIEVYPNADREGYRDQAKKWTKATYGIASVGAAIGTATLIWGIIELHRAKRGDRRTSAWLTARRNLTGRATGGWPVLVW